MTRLIELHDVSKVYASGAGKVIILKDISLQVSAGEFVIVSGPSGSGKTTLLNMITGIDRPTKGDVFVCGQRINRMSEDRLASWRGRNIGVVFQFFQLLPTLTILENVMLPMDFCNVHRGSQRGKYALTLLDMVGLVQHAHKLPNALSGGEQQRAAIARALANDPPLLVADEPTGNLDSVTAHDVFALFESLAASGKTLFVVTHDRDLSARTQHIISLRDGCIVSNSHSPETT